jgi:PAS domain S-box-containing protein
MAENVSKKRPLKTDFLLSEAEMIKLIHEVEVHQIELDIQNEELMLARSAALVDAEKYSELYDFAPSGYLTLSKEGKIIELNLCGSQMLGKERLQLKDNRFGVFISDDTKPILNNFFENVFKSKAKESCEVTLSTNSDATIYVHLSGIVIENGEQCLVTMVDITERKQAEMKIQHHMKELQRWQEVTLGREDRNRQLKQEVNELLVRLGETIRYPSQESNAPQDPPDGVRYK